MFTYKFPPIRKPLGQAMPSAAMSAIPDPVAPPEPTFTGLPGLVESVLVLGVLSAAAWVGIRTGMKGTEKSLKAAGWVGGVGSTALGLIYLGTKAGLTQEVGLPAMRVTPV